MTIWTNGCFDFIHAGHVEMLEYAKSLGTKLVVGLDSDERVKKSKGISRPVHNLQQRIKVISSLRFVDEVVTFSSDDELIQSIKDSGAQLIVVGSDYRGKRVIGSEIIDVAFFERVENLSSTRIINENCI